MGASERRNAATWTKLVGPPASGLGLQSYRKHSHVDLRSCIKLFELGNRLKHKGEGCGLCNHISFDPLGTQVSKLKKRRACCECGQDRNWNEVLNY